MTWLIIILPALLAGFLQGLTGFGAVIMMMVFFPLILPIPAAAGIACVIMIASQVVITWRTGIILSSPVSSFPLSSIPLFQQLPSSSMT